LRGGSRDGVRAASARYRRSASLVVYWRDGELIFENYALQKTVSAAPLVCSILDFCDKWRSVRSVCSHLKVSNQKAIQRALEQLYAHGMLERFGKKADPRVEAIKEWSAWNPAAGFFHFSTKDTAFAMNQAKAFEDWWRRAGATRIPEPLKSIRGARRTKLPAVEAAGEFPEVLRERRTWRKYGAGAVPLESLSQILKLTFGIQGWVEVAGVGRAAIKTSPSGGDLHPTEAYVLVQRVDGVKPGIYHYQAARHEVEWLRGGVSRRTLERNLGGQRWFSRAAFLVAMTTVSGRTRWKYDYPRAYRALLLEAGHLAQTFCLTATWLGLAPFSTIAMKDTKWEEWLGIDGVKESVLYIVGAGTRPEDVAGAHLGTLGRKTLLK